MKYFCEVDLPVREHTRLIGSGGYTYMSTFVYIYIFLDIMHFYFVVATDVATETNVSSPLPQQISSPPMSARVYIFLYRASSLYSGH